MRSGYIYKITNNINKKMYIGQTSYSLERRWTEHKSCFNKNVQYPLYRAFRKYGIENFKMELVEKCNISDLNDREIYWIQFYDTYKNGYNATLGGEGCRTFNIPEEDIISSYKELKSVNKVMKKYHCRKEHITDILRNNNIHISSPEELAKSKGCKISRLDLNNNVLEEYECYMDASRWIKENFLLDTQIDTIRMRLKSSIIEKQEYCGYFWEFKDCENYTQEKNKTKILKTTKKDLHKKITSLNLKKSNHIISLNLKKSNKKKHFCSKCGIEITKNSRSLCSDCYKKQQAKNIPPRDVLKSLVREVPFVHIGEQFGVSGTAVHKWCKKYNIPSKSSEIKKYSDEEWKLL